MCCFYCMLSSTLFHTYNCISEKMFDIMWRIDLIGIGVMMFGICLTMVWGAFHEFRTLRLVVEGTMLTICCVNFLFQMTPCYMRPDYKEPRVLFFFVLGTLTFAITLLWYFYVASLVELQLLSSWIFLAFFYMGFGFSLFHTQFPESKYGDS
jgi:predicted membrane channel-forming protein YqfA (hemolysin III family)